jgi:hypothetical protein
MLCFNKTNFMPCFNNQLNLFYIWLFRAGFVCSDLCSCFNTEQPNVEQSEQPNGTTKCRTDGTTKSRTERPNVEQIQILFMRIVDPWTNNLVVFGRLGAVFTFPARFLFPRKIPLYFKVATPPETMSPPRSTPLKTKGFKVGVCLCCILRLQNCCSWHTVRQGGASSKEVSHG